MVTFNLTCTLSLVIPMTCAVAQIDLQRFVCKFLDKCFRKSFDMRVSSVNFSDSQAQMFSGFNLEVQKCTLSNGNYYPQFSVTPVISTTAPISGGYKSPSIARNAGSGRLSPSTSKHHSIVLPCLGPVRAKRAHLIVWAPPPKRVHHHHHLDMMRCHGMLWASKGSEVM